MYQTPILFLIFARPDTTQRVFERIRDIRPLKLYIAADAPRKDRPNEIVRSQETRRIVDKIDWPCEVHTLFRNENLGCKSAVSSAITWFFDKEEYGVILEDDCLPDLSFFPFCEELLIRYKDDDRIGHIGGNNFLTRVDNNLSYDFCSIAHIWGWASWRRVWRNYDVNLGYWKKALENTTMMDSLFKSLKEKIYFSSFISDTLSGNKGLNTWDIQYYFMLRVQNQLSIYPSVNLVTNIGLSDPNATHTTKKSLKNYIDSTSMSFPLKHPEYIIPNKCIDDKTVTRMFFSYKRLFRYVLCAY